MHNWKPFAPPIMRNHRRHVRAPIAFAGRHTRPVDETNTERIRVGQSFARPHRSASHALTHAIAPSVVDQQASLTYLLATPHRRATRQMSSAFDLGQPAAA